MCKYFVLNATKVVKINNPNLQFKLRIRILSGSKNVVGFRIRITTKIIDIINPVTIRDALLSQ